ncbi:hypothetical protein TRFO_31945 [Tritrichomonas foetus]|uniref:Uncharacterized protein n=1 Tax=Tritrichomonas foetus TaxID=1144522 RepID=A0A1J4JR92_9EUKA|nr:hypothetical protein TRFO_31945 [Tritrichomonas foetus]|eukprot:OHT01274.1 hypothetical protein TRFO_31945 [Tritrichomonas foetus]
MQTNKVQFSSKFQDSVHNKSDDGNCEDPFASHQSIFSKLDKFKLNEIRNERRNSKLFKINFFDLTDIEIENEGNGENSEIGAPPQDPLSIARGLLTEKIIAGAKNFVVI